MEECSLPGAFRTELFRQSFEHSELFQDVSHMDFLSEPQVVLVEDSILLVHLAASALLTAVDLTIRGEDLKAVPGDTVSPLDNSFRFLAIERVHIHEVLLLSVEHVAHEKHLVTMVLENDNDEEEN